MSIITNTFRSSGRYLADRTLSGVCSLSTKRRDMFRSLQEQHKPTSTSCRYVIRDRSDHTYTVLPYIRPTMENKYVTRRVNIEKRKYFENMENIQKQWYKIMRNNQVPQTTYNSLNPNLWMKVKDMYQSSNFYNHPETFYKHF